MISRQMEIREAGASEFLPQVGFLALGAANVNVKLHFNSIQG